ncbi:MAG TPA: S-adenosylmethionine:tRNA ribosyltransferase-isomerase [Candidatus Coprenecus stercoravium]|uniref:S-adenosylmethionine:tRNA ribosyltransferase-isomerase n=1 Tax=Candidatus Coprenecus stercoravium TaxID=2840735 RepID=A0A9D2K8W6_9BACT|nr:S-adenosylmethionine:tRNA ribosyltransferase-isomerase [Candidatus Coprenecus stercoravium]
MPIPEINISDYIYELPDDRIAAYPAGRRDASKLLLYNKGGISQDIFSSLPDYVPSGSLMVFNNTKVVPARLLFRRATGAMIEIFCLEPSEPEDYNLSFASTSACVWKAIVGNRKKWKGEPIQLYLPDDHKSSLDLLHLTATLVSADGADVRVRFTWDGGVPFSQVMEMCGRVPIPPYLHRESESIDTERYQTLYASYRGSVAAPTAGLHFTDEVLSSLESMGIVRRNVCLHVGAGTFLPVKSESISGHAMHSEPFSISSSVLNDILKVKGNKPIIAVGTTSVRTLESLYWLGADCAAKGPSSWEPSPVEQWVPYTSAHAEIPLSEALGALVDYADRRSTDRITCRTRIIIVPSYRFRVVDWLITNFHQPKSTLLLLIAALIGEDWRKVYDYALGHGFRFLSYGDSSLLIPR